MSEQSDMAAVDRFSSTRGKLLLWAVFLVPPAIWMLDLLIMYSLQRYVCRTGASWLFHLTTAVLLLPVVWAGWTAWDAWRQAGASSETAGAGVASRSRFMAVSALAYAVAFGVLIIAEWIPTLVLPPCS